LSWLQLKSSFADVHERPFNSCPGSVQIELRAIKGELSVAMDVGSTQHPHAAAAAAAAAVASNPGQQQQRVPTHLIVMVNGLWGFQRDWNKMQQALQAADRQGKCLIHVSSVNTGAQTYYGEQQHCSAAQVAVFLTAPLEIQCFASGHTVAASGMVGCSSLVCMCACSLCQV
jgi:hypothetical protein